MDLSKVTRPQVLIIGGVLTLIVVIGIYFGLIKPGFDRLAAAQSRYETAKVTVDKEAEYKRILANNKKKVVEAQQKWAVVDRRFMPQGNREINISNLIEAMQRRWYEQVKYLGPDTEAFIKRDKTVRTYPAISVPAPPTDPNELDKKVIELPLGTVTAEGTFENLLRHAERWNNFNRLVLVDGLNLSGNSPHLTTSYTLTAYVFTHGEAAGPKVPVAAPSTGGGGGFPGGFGGRGGYPGAGGFTPPAPPPPAAAGGGGGDQGG